MEGNNIEKLIELEFSQMNDIDTNVEGQEIDTLLDVTDEEIQESMKLAEKVEKKAGRPKKKINIQADALVADSCSEWMNMMIRRISDQNQLRCGNLSAVTLRLDN